MAPKAYHHGNDVIDYDKIFAVKTTAKTPRNSMKDVPVYDGEPINGLTYMFPLNSILPNPDNPRKTIIQSEIEELAGNIRTLQMAKQGWGKSGLLQPIVIRPVPGQNGKFYVVAGERRFLAFSHNGQKYIPASYYDVNAAEAAVLSIIENVQRVDVPPIEMGMAYSALRGAGMTVNQISETTNKKASEISALISLIKRPKDIQELVDKKPGYLTRAVTLESLPVQVRKPIIKMALSGTPSSVVREKIATEVAKKKVKDSQKETPAIPVMPSYDLMRGFDSALRQLQDAKGELAKSDLDSDYWNRRVKAKLKLIKEELDNIAELGGITY